MYLITHTYELHKFYELLFNIIAGNKFERNPENCFGIRTLNMRRESEVCEGAFFFSVCLKGVKKLKLFILCYKRFI